jgi:hypothetical protein
VACGQFGGRLHRGVERTAHVHRQAESPGVRACVRAECRRKQSLGTVGIKRHVITLLLFEPAERKKIRVLVRGGAPCAGPKKAVYPSSSSTSLRELRVRGMKRGCRNGSPNILVTFSV